MRASYTAVIGPLAYWIIFHFVGGKDGEGDDSSGGSLSSTISARIKSGGVVVCGDRCGNGAGKSSADR